MQGYIGIQNARYRRCNYAYLIEMHSSSGGRMGKKFEHAKLIK